MKKYLIFLFLFLLFGCSEHRLNYLLNKDTPSKFLKADVLTSDGVLKANYFLKVADKDYQLKRGIMFEDKMDGYDGVLMFCDGYNFKTVHSKNVKIPLDIILLNDNNVISYITSLKEEVNGRFTRIEFSDSLIKVIELEKGKGTILNVGDRFFFYE